MPALSTHVLHSRDCLEKLKPEIEKNGIAVNDDFVGFVGAAAISHDTLGLLQGTAHARCFVEAHETKTDAFFLAMVAFIKENNLKANANAMAFLYGHIMHYALDTSAHPLIYYMATKHPAKFLVDALDAHTLLEAWIDSEREKALKAKDEAAGKTYDPKFPFRKRAGGSGIDALINTVYENVYGLKNAAAGYRNGIKIWKFYQFRMRSMMLKHVKEYVPDFEAMLNPNCETFRHPISGDDLSMSFQQAYDASIELACELVRAVNANIYDSADNEAMIKTAFANSYDSGLAWEDPRQRQYYKQYPTV